MFLLVLAQFVIYFPVGYLFLNKRIKSFHFLEKFTLFVTFGLTTDVIILSIMGFLYVGYEVLISITAIAYGLILVPKIIKIIRGREKNISGTDKDNSQLRKFYFVQKLRLLPRKLLQNLVPILVLLLVVGHFSLVGDYIGWPPGIDAINHGFLTSLLNHNHKLETNLSPTAPDEPWFEPFGFHLISSNLSLLFNIFPGESILAFATTILILIFLLIYSAAYRLTGSTSLAVLSLFSGFFIYTITSDARFLEKWLIGYYYNTPYPTLFGYLTLLQFIVLQFIVPTKEVKSRFLSYLTTGLSIISIGLAYTPFIILPLVYIFASIAKKAISNILSSISRFKTINNNKSPLIRILVNRKNLFLIIFLVTISIFIYVIMIPHGSTISLGKFSTLIQRVQANAHYYSTAVLVPETLYNLTGIWTVITSIIAIMSLVKGNRVKLTVFYLMMSTPILITLLANLVVDVTWFLFPGRLFAFLIIFNWIMLAAYINDILQRILKKRLSTKLALSVARASISLSLITAFFLPSILSSLTLEQADNWDWLFGREVFKNDYALMSWMSKNTNSSDLIMVDYSFASRSIHSFSIKNVTHNPFPSTPKDVELDKDNIIAWERPSLLKSFIDRYDVKYILLDSEPYHRVSGEAGGDDTYHHKLFTVNEYNEIFGKMTFLKLVKQYGTSSVYKVINENRSTLQQNHQTY